MAAVSGFLIDVKAAEVVAVEIDADTATVTLVVPVGDVDLTFEPSKLVRKDR